MSSGKPFLQNTESETKIQIGKILALQKSKFFMNEKLSEKLNYNIVKFKCISYRSFCCTMCANVRGVPINIKVGRRMKSRSLLSEDKCLMKKGSMAHEHIMESLKLFILIFSLEIKADL